jgi:RND superfamily putative drug exporter
MSDPSPLIRAQNIIFNATTGMGIYTYYTTFLPNSREIAEFFNLTTWNSDNKITDYALNTVKNLPLTQLLASFPQELQPQLSPIYSQFISPDNKTMLISIDFSEKSSAIKGCIPQIRNDAKQVANNLGILDNVELYVTGEPAFDHDIQEETFKDIERIDPISIGLIILIIGLFFASVLSPLIPLGAIGISIIAAFACVFLIGTFVAHVYFIILTFLPMSMLGAGCDYGIFLMSRFYEERKKGKSKEEAVETAVTWAGESIATSGATVIISFGAMSLASFGMIKTLGLTVMLGIAIALIAALTFVPSILMLLGDKLFWPRKLLKDNNGEVIPNRKSRISYYRKSARFTVKHAKLIVIVALLVTVPATIGALSFPGSHDFIAQTPKNMESRAGFDAMAEGFGQGALSFTKTLIVVQFNDKITDGNTFNQTILEAISLLENKTAQLSGISKVYGPTRYDGRPFNYSQLNDPNIPAYQRSQLVQNVLNFIGSSKNTALILVELSYEPYTNEALDAVGMLRNEIKELRNANSDIALNEAEVYVGGVTASTRDITAIVDADFVNMLIMVMVGVFIVLMFALGSIFTPLRLILTITLSIAWTLAIVNLVFQVWLGIPMIWMIPMILFILMMGLGMDYDIFLVTRIREGVIKGMSDEEAIEHAVERTGGIISACGFVMAGALGSLMLSTMPMLQQFGLALFAVVLLDAMFVRIYLVPAIMMLLKKYNWWAPKRIRRVPEREDKLVNC